MDDILAWIIMESFVMVGFIGGEAMIFDPKDTHMEILHYVESQGHLLLAVNNVGDYPCTQFDVMELSADL